MNEHIAQLKKIDNEIQLLQHTNAVLGWDQETLMPQEAISERSEQLSLLGGIIHERETSSEIGDLLGKLGAGDENPLGSEELEPSDRAFVRAVYQDYVRLTRIPVDLVRRLTKKASVGQAAWAKARQDSDFAAFAPHLNDLIELALETSECLGYTDHPYDALLDQYEPGMTTADVAGVFAELKEGLVPLVAAIADAQQVNDRVLKREYPEELQETFGREVLKAIGFSGDRGRLDTSVHPFTTSLGSDDVRLTTRYDRSHFPTSLFGIIHEGGHGMYEQGFDRAYHGTRLADGTSLGIHESMSRFWENVVGRSRPFWEHYYPRFRQLFPEQTEDVDLDEFYRAINKVEPSLIRVEADEVTYSLHIILRFELEQQMVSKSVSTNDLPDAWRSLSKDLLGIVPERDADGVLQDIHWSMGGIGYFPTYALGNVYGLQFVGAMKAQLHEFDALLRAGELAPVKAWLDENIHRHGRAKLPKELCMDISGAELSAKPFLAYLRNKYREIYRLSGV